MTADPLELYYHYHLNRDDDRLGMFRLLLEHFPIHSVLYPGCFVHLTPALVCSQVFFVDSDRRARSFFGQPAVMDYIRRNKSYAEDPQVVFLPRDYTQPLPIEEASVNLLISQYAGFVSQHCTRYLQVGGYLLANNSHGDASLAALDERYRLAGTLQRRKQRFTLHTDNLEEYLVPKSGQPVDRQALLASGRGVGYTRPASAYIFQRVT
jgi:hypothetical protein